MKEEKIERWGRAIVTIFSLIYLALIICFCTKIDLTQTGTDYGPGMAHFLNHSFPASYMTLFIFLTISVYVLIRKLRANNSIWQNESD